MLAILLYSFSLLASPRTGALERRLDSRHVTSVRFAQVALSVASAHALGQLPDGMNTDSSPNFIFI